MTESTSKTLAEVKAALPGKPETLIVPGFFSEKGMELLEKSANLLTYSDMVPAQYRSFISNSSGHTKENKSGFSNCIVAVNLAHSMGMDVLTVMQNMHVIEGKPSWSAAFIIARINASGMFSRLRFDISEPGDEVAATYREYSGYGKDQESKQKTAVMRKQSCRAWAKDLQTGEVLSGTTVTVDMAIAERWACKNGSKWHTMQEQMLMYRAAAFWCRVHAPELLHGLPTDDEVRDTIDADIVDGVLQAKPLDKSDLLAPKQRRSSKRSDAQDVDVKDVKDSESNKNEANESAVADSSLNTDAVEAKSPTRRTRSTAEFNVE